MNITVRKAEQRRSLPEGTQLPFGRYFTDHMFIMDFDRQRGWHDQRIVPYGPISLDPAAAVLHYAQEAFEGLKAWRSDSGRVHLFRPDRHAQRLQATTARLCMPAIEPDLFMKALLAFVSIERSWVPSQPNASLYIRPTLIATEAFLGVRPADAYLFYLIASPVGAYYAEASSPCASGSKTSSCAPLPAAWARPRPGATTPRASTPRSAPRRTATRRYSGWTRKSTATSKRSAR